MDLQNFLCLEEIIYDKLYILISHYFNSNKFIDYFIQLQYLVTMGELLVLDNDTKKKNHFSKRLALLVECTDEDKKSTYNSLREIYRLRSNWIHDGNDKGIDLDEVNKLRVIISGAIKEYISRMKIEIQSNPDITFKKMKSKIMQELKKETRQLGDRFFIKHVNKC